VPTVITTGPYRLFFYSNEGAEPVHVHVERDGVTAKFWILPVRLASSGRFGRRELRLIESIVLSEEENVATSWRRHFGE
jgi:hypothetical protein